MTTFLELFVHFVEQYVRQQRRQWAALRRTLMSLRRYTVGQHAGFQVAADESQHATITDALPELSHQHVVVHAVEELLQVHVHHDATTFLDEALRLHDCVVSASPRPEAVAAFREGRVEYRLQNLQQGLLDESVEHGRDAKLSHPTIALRNQLLFHL